MTEVSVVVPSHGSAGTLPALLDALERQSLPPDRWELLLVDPLFDGGHRVALERARHWGGGQLRLVRASVGGGPAAKRNAGARAARGSLLAFTDADCVPEPGWLEAGLAAAQQGFGLIQGRVLLPAGAEPDVLSHPILVEHDHGLFETANVFYERSLFESLGGFTSRYYRRFGVPYGEDAELGWRARRAGARFHFEREAVVRHPLERASLGSFTRARLLARGFPLLVREVPELRDAFLWRRWFLSPRSAAFASAVAGAALARRHPAAGVLALPYARSLAQQLPPRDAGPRTRARALGVRLLGDSATFAALAWGSARARRLVI